MKQRVTRIMNGWHTLVIGQCKWLLSVQVPHCIGSLLFTHRESDRSTRWIKEAVHIRKKGRSSMKRDEGSYTLSHMYNRFLATSHHYRGKNWKKN